MSSMSSYSIGVSGLRNAQSGLSTTGHNMSNSSVQGYTRQSNIQETFLYRTYSESKVGLLQIGMGTDLSEIRQIRNKFFDAEYREEAATSNYYAAKYVAGQEVENILGELESSYAAQEVISNVWSALNELSIYPDGIDTRSSFIETCVTFINKMQDFNSGLYNYQLNLNDQIKTTVAKINEISEEINELNTKISYAEINGDHANDYRDSRNLLIDELSTYLDITVKESANGTVSIMSNGKELVANGMAQRLGLKYSTPNSPFVEPVLSRETEILPSDANVISLFGDLSKVNLESGSDACSGLLKGQLIARGNVVGNFQTPDSQVGNFLIPRVEKQFDTLTNGIVTLLNDAFSSGKTYDLSGGTGVPIFTKISENGELTVSNIQVNPELLKSGGYNNLALSASEDVADTSVILDVMNQWGNGVASLGGETVNNYYKGIVDELSIEVDEASTYYDEHNGLLVSVDNKRQTLSGVSLDEELSYMLKYQYAYQASSKFINIIDSMIDKVVNSMGVVGR